MIKKHVAIVYRTDTKESLETTQQVVTWLKKNQCEVYTAPDQTLIKGTHKADKKDIKTMNLIVSIGGDGTYLRAAHTVEGYKVPILGINLGSLGFLTTTRRKEAFKNLEKALEQKMTLSPRSLISVKVFKKNKIVHQYLALNDVVIERGTNSQLINISLYFDDDHVSDIKADGLIIASPTGSTAYNLAAGGPILHPHVQAFTVTAVSPHSLTARPFIFPDNHELKLQSHISHVQLIIDGRKTLTLEPEHTVKIRRHSEDHLMAIDKDHDYFKLLKEKLKFGERA